MLFRFTPKIFCFCIPMAFFQPALGESATTFDIPNTMGAKITCDRKEFDALQEFAVYAAFPAEMKEQLLFQQGMAQRVVLSRYFTDRNFSACSVVIEQPSNEKFEFEFAMQGGNAKFNCKKDFVDLYTNMNKTPGYPYTQAQLDGLAASTKMYLQAIGNAIIREGYKDKAFGCEVVSTPRKGGAARLASLVGAKTEKAERKVAKPKTPKELRLERIKGDLLRVKDNGWREPNGAFVKLTLQDFWFATRNGDSELKKLIMAHNKFKTSGELKLELARISQDFVPTFYGRYKNPKFITELEEPIFEYINQQVEAGVLKNPQTVAGVFYYIWANTYEDLAGYMEPFPNGAEWERKVNDKSITAYLSNYQYLAKHIEFFESSSAEKRAKHLERFNAEYPQVIERYSFPSGA